MKKLDDSDVIRLMREEYELTLEDASKEIDMFFKSKDEGDEQNIISPELKVQHIKSGLKYTVSSVSPRDVILRTPEGKTFLVDKESLEREYELE